MKHYLKTLGTISLIIALSQTSFSQIEAGRKIIGASSNMGLSSTSSGGNSTSTLQLNTNFGYLITKNFAIGADFGFTSTSSGGFSSTSIFYDGFARIYIKNFYPEFKIGRVNTNNGFGTSSSNLYYGAGIGYAISLNDFISIDPKISYTKVNYVRNNTHNIGMTIGFNLYF
ncbi:MAG: hypothetical protein ACPGSO_08800 [Vicingaceae bacterium]